MISIPRPKFLSANFADGCRDLVAASIAPRLPARLLSSRHDLDQNSLRARVHDDSSYPRGFAADISTFC